VIPSRPPLKVDSAVPKSLGTGLLPEQQLKHLIAGHNVKKETKMNERMEHTFIIPGKWN
jgi:hypothetical protein